MTVELIKQEEITGKMWYLVRIDDATVKAFKEDEKEQAHTFYVNCIEFAKTNGAHQKETVLDTTFINSNF